MGIRRRPPQIKNPLKLVMFADGFIDRCIV